MAATRSSAAERHGASRLPTCALFLSLVLIAAAVSFARHSRTVLRPVLAVEDGRDVFGYYYNHREPSSVFRKYHGYVSLLPNIAGYTLLALPTRLVPHALTLFPLLVSSLALSWFSLPRFRELMGRDSSRCAACVALIALPLGNQASIGNTMYSSWNFLLIMALQTAAPAPEGAFARARRFLGMSLLAWSHPGSALLVPFHVMRAVRSRSRGAALFWWGLAAVTVLYVAVGANPPRPGGLALQTLASTTASFVAERILFAIPFGDEAARTLRDSGRADVILWGAALVFAAVVAGAFLARRRLSRPGLAFLVLAAYMSLALTAFYVAARRPGDDVFAYHKAYRYFWVQRFLCVIAIAVVLQALFRDRVARLRPTGKALLAAALSAWLVALNVQNIAAYSVDAAEGERLAEFIDGVARQEALRGGRDGVSARLERGKWSIVLER